LRIALGAESRQVIWLVIRRVVPALATGTFAGAAFLWLASIWIRTLLYGVQPFDPWTASAALVLLLAIGIAAAAAPAFRAVRVDPASTLRQE
jgi:ABC-type antimicrobial peptide transport system permease subunit